WRWQLGRLIVTVSLQPGPTGLQGSRVFLGWGRLKPQGRTLYPRTRSYLPMILVTLGGPLASLGLAAACAALNLLTYHLLVRLVWVPSRDVVWGMQVMTVVAWLGLFGVTGLVATLQGLANLFPRRL